MSPFFRTSSWTLWTSSSAPSTSGTSSWIHNWTSSSAPNTLWTCSWPPWTSSSAPSTSRTSSWTHWTSSQPQAPQEQAPGPGVQVYQPQVPREQARGPSGQVPQPQAPPEPALGPCGKVLGAEELVHRVLKIVLEVLGAEELVHRAQELDLEVEDKFLDQGRCLRHVNVMLPNIGSYIATFEFPALSTNLEPAKQGFVCLFCAAATRVLMPMKAVIVQGQDNKNNPGDGGLSQKRNISPNTARSRI